MLCLLELDDKRIAVAGLTAEGLSLFNVTYDGKTLYTEKSPLLPDNVSPERIIADLQLVFWPLDEMQKILSGRWRVEANNKHRRLYSDKDPHVDIHYLSDETVWPKNVTLVNYRYHYSLTINTLSYETLPQ